MTHSERFAYAPGATSGCPLGGATTQAMKAPNCFADDERLCSHGAQQQNKGGENEVAASADPHVTFTLWKPCDQTPPPRPSLLDLYCCCKESDMTALLL